jgi:hypothetical protein
MELLAIRRVILGVLLLGMGGSFAELVLLEHYIDFKQLIPLALLATGLTAVLVDLLAPREWTRMGFQFCMVFFIAAGLLGVVFHYQGSRAFQLEMDPSLRGTALLLKVLHAKSPPTLSPGLMIQLGILGLGYAYLRRNEQRSRM